MIKIRQICVTEALRNHRERTRNKTKGLNIQPFLLLHVNGALLLTFPTMKCTIICSVSYPFVDFLIHIKNISVVLLTFIKKQNVKR